MPKEKKTDSPQNAKRKGAPKSSVAQLIRRKAEPPLVLLKTEMSAGHFARSGRYDSWRDEAFVLAFVLDQLGAGESLNPTNPGL